MNSKEPRRVLCMIGFAVLSLLTATSTTLAQDVIIEGNTATGIRNLDVGGTLYDVDFLLIDANTLYGTSPPIFDFPQGAQPNAQDAAFAVNTVLNTEPVVTEVGPDPDVGVPDYGIPFKEETDITYIAGGTYIGRELSAWFDADIDVRIPAEPAMYADFRLAGSEPPPPSEEEPPAKGIPFDVTGVTDIDNDAMPDVALLAYKGDPKVRYFSGQSRQVIRSVKYFSASWFPVAAATVADANSNGVANDPAVAVLARKTSEGKISVEIRRADTGEQIKKISFLGSQWLALDVAVVDDKNGDGVTGDTIIAVLAYSPDQAADDRIRVQTRRLSDGSVLRNVSFHNSSWRPVALEAVNRLGRSALLAVLARKPLTGNNSIQTRKLDDGSLQRDTAVWDNTWLARDVAILKDSNGDSTADDPAYLVLANHADGRNKVQGKRVSDGENIHNLSMLGTAWIAKKVMSSGDLSGNLIEEVGALGRKDDGTIAIQLKDFGDKTATKTIYP